MQIFDFSLLSTVLVARNSTQMSSVTVGVILVACVFFSCWVSALLLVLSYYGEACGRSVGDSPTFGFRRVSMPASGPEDILKGPLIVGILDRYPPMLYLLTCWPAVADKVINIHLPEADVICITGQHGHRMWAGYSDSLWAGQSGDLIPVGVARFSAPV